MTRSELCTDCETALEFVVQCHGKYLRRTRRRWRGLPVRWDQSPRLEDAYRFASRSAADRRVVCICCRVVERCPATSVTAVSRKDSCDGAKENRPPRRL